MANQRTDDGMSERRKQLLQQIGIGLGLAARAMDALSDLTQRATLALENLSKSLSEQDEEPPIAPSGPTGPTGLPPQPLPTGMNGPAGPPQNP